MTERGGQGVVDLQSWARYLEQDREILGNWRGQGRFDIYFSTFFDCYSQGLIFGGETGRWAMSPPKLRFFKYFLIS